MNKYIFYLLVIVVLIGLLWCGKGDDIVGSRTDTIENMEVTSPFLLADGISTAIIVATVYDSSGKPASDLPVHFNTTAGTITEQVFSQSDGYAYAILKSAASETDLKVTVTATVLDTTFGLQKPNFGLHKINLKIQDFKKYPDRRIDLKKCSASGDNSATIELTFLGIDFKAELDATNLPADGISKAKIKVTIKEATSKKAVTEAEVDLAAAHGTIINKIQTNNQGIAETDLTAHNSAVSDTVYVEYGDLFLIKLSINYDAPQMSLTPETTFLLADGESQASFVVTVKSQKNTPVSGAEIKFSTTAGTISPSSVQTNAQGQGQALLISATKVDTNILVIASLNSFSDTSFVSFIQPGLTLTPSLGELAADGNSEMTFTATLLLPDNTPVVDAEINFSTSAGTITPNIIKTNSEGRVQATLKSDFEPNDNVTITASFQDLSQTSTVKFISPILIFTPSAGELSADGTSQMTFTASLLLPNNTPLTGSQISFSASAGTITPPSGITNSEGRVQTTLKSGYEANPNVVVTASFQSMTQTSTISFVSPILTLAPSEAKLVANGVSKQVFTATLVSSTNTPIPDAEIQFSTTNGTLLNSTVITNSEGKAQTELRSSKTPDDNVLVISKFHNVADTSLVTFVESSSETGLLLSGESQLFRDGISSTQITATVLDDDNNPVPDATIFFNALYGQIPSNAVTDAGGIAVVTYTPDVNVANANEVITATMGSSVVTHEIQLFGLTMTILATPDSIPADGSSESQIQVQLKLTESQMAVPGINISFSADLGFIATSAATNAQGVATILLRTTSEAGTATVTAQYGGFIKTVQVQFYLNSPQSLLLVANPNYIWVRETGNLEQSTITATVLGVQGQPIGHEVAVKFYLQNGPGEGAGFVVAGSDPATESEPIMTASGQASIGFRSGTRSGTVEIRAELVDSPSTVAQTTNLVIRSGPPYIWIDPADPSNVVSHMTLTLDYFNLAGWSHLTDYKVSVLIGDKYNNPVELGTTVYFTTTGGVITTDVKTDCRGMGSVLLASGEPKPYVCPLDSRFNPHTIENPNDPGNYLPIVIPDFEGGEITNSCGDTGENDGLTVISAYTHGRDQNGNEAKVWSTSMVVFGGPTAYYDVYVSPPVDTLNLGETAFIHIKVWDINGNPPAAGSSLKAETSAGKISSEDLMPDKENYGFGSTYFTTTLLNNLDPVEDEPVMAEVSVELNTPFGKISKAVYVYLKIN